jgi:glyoxylase-like metal-dependent hydrolase (beta-lactamase superfamily II)
MMKLIPVNAGYFKLDGGAMFGVVPQTLWKNWNKPDENNLCTWAMRCLLVDTGDRRILIDCGMGDKQSQKFFSYYQPSGPTLLESLQSVGYRPEEITDVFLTHLHFDHCGGAVYFKDGDPAKPALTFPNALHWSNAQHWESALNPNARERASFLKENLLPIQDSGRLRFIDGPGSWLPGIRVEFVHGHTDAQMLPVISREDGTELIYMADLVASRHHLRTAYVMAYDIRPLETLVEKDRLLNDASKKGMQVFFEHDPEVACITIQGENGRFEVKDHIKL